MFSGCAGFYIITFVTTITDDTFIPQNSFKLQQLIKDMEKSSEAIAEWLTQIGLKVNQSKTELCLFHRNDVTPISVSSDCVLINTSKNISVCGLLFDWKLNWSDQVSSANIKANKFPNAIKLIRNFFNVQELIQLVTSNYYSIWSHFICCIS